MKSWHTADSTRLFSGKWLKPKTKEHPHPAVSCAERDPTYHSQLQPASLPGNLKLHPSRTPDSNTALSQRPTHSLPCCVDPSFEQAVFCASTQTFLSSVCLSSFYLPICFFFDLFRNALSVVRASVGETDTLLWALIRS